MKSSKQTARPACLKGVRDMKATMRDKVCQLIGKYQFLEEDFRSKSFFKSGPFCGPYGQEEAVKAKMCGQFLTDLNKLLEEDEKEDTTHE